MTERPTKITVPVALLESLVDADPCKIDRFNDCQTHGYVDLGPDEKCPQNELLELLDGLDP